VAAVISDRVVIADTNVISYILRGLPIGEQYARRRSVNVSD